MDTKTWNEHVDRAFTSLNVKCKTKRSEISGSYKLYQYGHYGCMIVRSLLYFLSIILPLVSSWNTNNQIILAAIGLVIDYKSNLLKITEKKLNYEILLLKLDHLIDSISRDIEMHSSPNPVSLLNKYNKQYDAAIFKIFEISHDDTTQKGRISISVPTTGNACHHTHPTLSPIPSSPNNKVDTPHDV